jgi:hypothetical protein
VNGRWRNRAEATARDAEAAVLGAEAAGLPVTSVPLRSDRARVLGGLQARRQTSSPVPRLPPFFYMALRDGGPHAIVLAVRP